MNTQEIITNTERLIGKAAKAEDANDAMKFSQAAANASNALANMAHVIASEAK